MTSLVANQLNILILGNSAKGGGAELSMRKLMQELILRNYSVDYCSINDTNEDIFPFGNFYTLRRYKDSGVRNSLKALRSLRSLIKEKSYSHIIVNTELAELFATIGILSSTRLIIVEHTSRPWSGRKMLGRVVRMLLRVHKPIWVTVNSTQESIWPNHEKPIYIPNPVMPTKMRKVENETDLVFVGRLNVSKRPELVAKAALETNLSVSFFGDGPLLPSLKATYQSSKCAFLGYIENPWEQISQNSILVVTSEFEGDGLTIVEGALNGNPLLLVDNPDLRRFKFPDIHYFTDLSELVFKLRDTSKNGRSRFILDKKFAEPLRENRDVQKIANKWEHLILENIGKYS